MRTSPGCCVAMMRGRDDGAAAGVCRRCQSEGGDEIRDGSGQLGSRAVREMDKQPAVVSGSSDVWRGLDRCGLTVRVVPNG